MNTVTLKIEGMHCQSCVARVKRALEKTEGVKVNDVQIGSASVETNDVEEVLNAIADAGYTAAES